MSGKDNEMYGEDEEYYPEEPIELSEQTLKALGLSTTAIRDRIIEGAINALVKQYRSRVYDEIEKQVSKALTEEIGNKISEMTTTVLSTKYQPVNMWGEKKGEPLTVRDELETQMKTWAETKVDNNGKPTTNTYGVYGTRIQWAARQVVSEAINKEAQKELQQILAAAKGEIMKTIASEVTSVVKGLWK